jgi:serine/threonine protein kinase/tetratricopeptide (TPR) repeat protein
MSLTVRGACDELSRRLRAGLPASAAEFLASESSAWSTPDAALELLYTEFVVREQLGQEPRPAEWLASFPQWHAELAQLFEIHALVSDGQTLARGLSATHDEAGAAVATDHAHADDRCFRVVGGYEIREEIGRGGMGVVYQARQRGLDRIVALKMILPPHGERERARFRTEAEATAKLSHPNIVAIYEVGQEGDLPFLSMEFVAGKGLDKLLADAPMAPRAAASLLLTLARAVSYAHEQGIVHRDLKPANIMLAADAMPKITDFGLAREVATAQVVAKGLSETPASVAIVGTPSYMAPEQCDSSGSIGPAADIYSLGAILYETLTGRPPFRGQTALDILDLVRSQEAVPPSRLAPKISRDLETICLKCLAKQPKQRYASAADLAEDLRRFLAGQPVRARPVPRIEHAMRWCQRNPLPAALAGGIALLLVAGTAVSTSLAVWALNEKTSAAEHARHAEESAEQAGTSAQEEQAARELAEYRFAQAEKAVEQYLDGIENDARLKEADFFDLRKQLLSSAMAFYEDFIQAKPGDAKLEAKRGRAYGRLALLRRQVGEHARSAADYRQMTSIFQKLAADFPAVPEHRQNQARGHHGLSVQLRELGRPKEALDEVRQAIALQEDLVAALPTVAAYRQDLAKAHHMLGTLLFGLGNHEAAVSEYQQVFSLEQPLAEQFPTNPAYRLDLSRSHNNLANVLYSLGKRAEAVDEMRQALSLKLALVAEFPKVAAYRQDLASSRFNLGHVFNELRQTAEAEAEHRQAMALRKSLADEYPTVPAYRLDLARSHYHLGRLLRNDKPLEAETELQKALTLRTKLNAEVFGVPEYRADLATSHAGLGSIHRALGKLAEATTGFQNAIDVWLPLLEEFPELHTHRSSMASHMNSLAILLRENGKLVEARQMHNQAIEHRLRLLNAASDRRFYASSLRSYYKELAETALVQKDHAEVVDAAGRMAKLRPDVASDRELAAQFLSRCVTLAKQDPALAESDGQALAILYADRAMEQLRFAVRRGYKNAASLKTQAAFVSLKSRPDFQQLIQELESK